MSLLGKKMKKLSLSILLVVAMFFSTVVLISCSDTQSGSSKDLKTYQTKTGKTIIISETHPAGQSLSTIEISTKGFEYDDAQTY